MNGSVNRNIEQPGCRKLARGCWCVCLCVCALESVGTREEKIGKGMSERGEESIGKKSIWNGRADEGRDT